VAGAVLGQLHRLQARPAADVQAAAVAADAGAEEVFPDEEAALGGGEHPRLAQDVGEVEREEQRAARRKQLEDEYREDVDLYKLAANLIVDDVVEPADLRASLIARFRAYATRKSARPDRKHGVPPV